MLTFIQSVWSWQVLSAPVVCQWLRAWCSRCLSRLSAWAAREAAAACWAETPLQRYTVGPLLDIERAEIARRARQPASARKDGSEDAH